MRFLQSLIGAIVAAALIYLAFIIGTVILKVMLGLVAIAVVVLVIMRLLGRR